MHKIFSFKMFWPFVIFLTLALSFGSRMAKPFRFDPFEDSNISTCLSSVIPANSIYGFKKCFRDELIKEYIANADLISREFIELVDVEGERKLDEIFSMMTPEAALCNKGYEKDWMYMNSDREVMVRTEIVDLDFNEEKSIVRLTDGNELIEIILPYEERICAYLNDGGIWEAIKYVEITLVERSEKLLIRKFFAEQREEAAFIGKWK
ncbi:MAG: hypothetical protein M1371_11655 [Actinobacteria bacterium]|nr:hypothetical protein [Actinomycetota bacterium]